MSIDVSIDAARAALDALIADVRASATADASAILIRIGQIDTRVAAAEAVARAGDTAAAELLAAAALRLIARDFPGRALPPLDLLAQDAAYRRIAARELAA